MRTKRNKSQWLEIAQKLCKGKGYFVPQDLKPYVASYKKHACEVQAIRLAEKGIAYPGNFKPQRYYLTPEEAAQAIAAKPPRKPVDFSKLPKCEVMQAPPSKGQTPTQKQDFVCAQAHNEHSFTRLNFTSGNNQLVTMVTAADMATGTKHHLRHRNYGPFGLHAFDVTATDRLPLLFNTLDVIRSIPLTVHNLSVTFQLPTLPDASMFVDIPDWNSCKRYYLKVNGQKVTAELYPTGKVNVKPCLTFTPIDPRDLSQLMDSIRSYIPFETPTTDQWQITTTDPAFDIPTTRKLKGFTTEFEWEGRDYHIYTKKLYGKWHLRVEWHAYPARAYLRNYIRFIDLAEKCLLRVIGK